MAQTPKLEIIATIISPPHENKSLLKGSTILLKKPAPPIEKNR